MIQNCIIYIRPKWTILKMLNNVILNEHHIYKVKLLMLNLQYRALLKMTFKINTTNTSDWFWLMSKCFIRWTRLSSHLGYSFNSLIRTVPVRFKQTYSWFQNYSFLYSIGVKTFYLIDSGWKNTNNTVHVLLRHPVHTRVKILSNSY